MAASAIVAFVFIRSKSSMVISSNESVENAPMVHVG
jgi:hypothetical protein